jgi:homoserine O-acetyltransferase
MRADSSSILNIPLPQPFKLKMGGELHELNVSYETYGTLNSAKDNAILVCHPLTMDAHVTNNGDESIEAGWWNFLIGPGKPIDTNQFYVIGTNVLGGCKGTTGPTSINPLTKEPYRTDFPEVTIHDMVDVQKMVVEQLGIKKLKAVLGGSLGGMQVLEWSVRYPDWVEKSIAIATGSQLSSQGLAFDVVGRQCVLNDPKWIGGTYDTEDISGITGLALARMIGHITYISKNMMDKKFGRKLQDGRASHGFNTGFAIESFLHYNSEKFLQRFDPNAYLYLSKSMDTYDMTEGFKDLGESLSRAKSSFLIVSFSSDWLFPPGDSIELATTLSNQGKSVTYANLETDLGHDAFLIESKETEDMVKLVSSFLQS